MGEKRVLWFSLDDAGSFIARIKPYQNHTIGLLRTILHNNNIKTELATTRLVFTKSQIVKQVRGFDILLMSVMSFNFPFAKACARIFKDVNPHGKVIVGGHHASVAIDEMMAVNEFDHICVGPGEDIITDLVKDPDTFHRIIEDASSKKMENWPFIDRTLAPKPLLNKSIWPLENYSIEEPPSVSVLTSRRCSWKCSFCNESSIIAHMKRKPVQMVIDELNKINKEIGTFNSVIIHDSNFFQNPSWLEEWIEKYPRSAANTWPYWASARTNMIRRNPELFLELVKKTNWRTISLGLESGSDPVLKILNKECTEEDNDYAIDLINTLDGVKIFANIILAIPGETPQDVYKTVDMINRIKNCQVSISYYSPYPGTVLGDDVIARGDNLMAKGDYHRYSGKALVKGIDYGFYQTILPKINKYNPPKLKERLGRYIFNALSRNILSTHKAPQVRDFDLLKTKQKIWAYAKSNMQKVRVNVGNINEGELIPKCNTLAMYLRNISKHKTLSAQEETDIAMRIHKGDRLALEKLVKSNLHFVVLVCKNYMNKGLPLGDLINEGNLGLVRAAKRFNNKQNIKFVSYAVWWIRQAILQTLAEHPKTMNPQFDQINM